MRSAWVLVLPFLTLLVATTTASAQAGALRPVEAGAAFGVFVGIGSGPAGATMVGMQAERPLAGPVALRVEGSRWSRGVGVICVEPPFVNDCDAGGHALLGGVVLYYLPATGRLTPYVAVDAGGFHRFRGLEGSGWNPAVAGAAGVRASLGRRWSARLGGKTLHELDGLIGAPVGEPLRYYVATLGLSFGSNW